MPNDFLSMSSAGVPVPTPMFQNGGFAPALKKMASEYAKDAAEFGTTFLGQTGLLDSSFKERVMSNAYSQGFQQAAGVYANQQQLFSDWANNMFQLKLSEGAKPKDPTMMQNILGGAISGMGIGASLGGGVGNPSSLATGGWGALIGGGLGLLGGLGGGSDRFLGIF